MADQPSNSELSDVNGVGILRGYKVKFVLDEHTRSLFKYAIPTGESEVKFGFGCFYIEVPGTMNPEAPYRIPFGCYPQIKIEVIV